MEEKHVWKVLDSYFEQNGLVKQQIDSYNQFTSGIEQIIDAYGKFQIPVKSQFNLGENFDEEELWDF